MEGRGSTHRVRPKSSEGRERSRTRTALGSPHDGYAAALLTLGLGLVYFGFGLGRALADDPEGTPWYVLVGAGLAVAVALPALWYFLRAHGVDGRSPGFAVLPGMAMYVAFGVAVSVISPALARATDSWWTLGLACVVLAALSVAPVQLVLSKDRDRAQRTLVP